MTSEKFPHKHLLHRYAYIVVKYNKKNKDVGIHILNSNEALHKFCRSVIKITFK